MATIMIVDDTPSELALMQSVVQRLGHSVIPAQNGKIAVQLAAQHKPNLVLLDIVMPEQDGFVTCRQIKKGEETSHIPIILVSSKSGDSDKFWGMKQGASDYLTKPFDPDQLAESINRFLQ
jgi:twitching motility two-component system response regulator PilH